MIAPVANTGADQRQTADPALRKAAQQFEAVFLREILATMRKGKLSDDVFGSQATDTYRDMADSRLADTLATRGQFGIARLVEQQFARGEETP